MTFFYLSFALLFVFNMSHAAAYAVDPWSGHVYKRNHKWLVEKCHQDSIRIHCYSQGLLSSQNLLHLREVAQRSGRLRHNEELLACLNVGGIRTYGGFLVALEGLGDLFDSKRLELAADIPNCPTPTAHGM